MVTRQHLFFHDDLLENEGYTLIETSLMARLADGTEYTVNRERLLEVDTTTHKPLDDFCSQIQANLERFTAALIIACQNRITETAIEIPHREKQELSK
jgi:hypothetical protein